MMIIIPIVAAVAAIGVAAAVMSQQGPRTNFGPLGSAHEHAVIEVRLDGTPIDFTQKKYQVQSQFIHLEGEEGFTVHRHATSVPVGEFFKSVGMNIENGCFITDGGTRYCEEGAKQLRYFVNGTRQASIMDYVLSQNDRILIIYGSESQEQLQAEFEKLNNIPIRG